MTDQPFRLTDGGRIDRSKPLSFTFDGRRYQGFAGDTLASALIANGVRMLGRGFKYHRPRGIMGAGLEEANAIVQLEGGARTSPNLKATEIELYDGLAARSINAWPSVKYDLWAAIGLVSRFMPAGFYYKTFMRPHWRFFEPFVRKAAGLGVSPTEPDPDYYEKRHAHCDVLVVGGGPAGLAAALAAGGGGARVILVDDKAEWGGSLLHLDRRIDGKPGLAWVGDTVGILSGRVQTTLLSRTTAVGYYDHNYVVLLENVRATRAARPRQRLWKVRAGRVILATGAIERPLVFPNNDRPGVMLASAVHQYAKRFAARAGRRAVVATNNDSAYEAALDVRRTGVEIAAIIDLRHRPEGLLVRQARAAGIAVIAGCAPTNIKGGRKLRGVEWHRLDENDRPVKGSVKFIPCDLVMTSAGWNPTVHLFSQSGGKLRFDQDVQSFMPERSVQAESSVGAANGRFSLAQGMEAAIEAGRAAATASGFPAAGIARPDIEEPAFGKAKPFWMVDAAAGGRGRKKAWVDLLSDVTDSDIALAARENFRSVEHVKRYTTLGMAPDQGKTSNVNAIGILHQEIGEPVSRIGATKFRPPFNPVTIGALAGRATGAHLNPVRRLPAHHAHVALGARMEEFGGWLRPACYPKAAEDEADAISREALAVRSSVGVFDGSPLGKIEVVGPDAAEFLNRVYVNNMKTLRVGKCRYGLMLNEHGVIMDDGILTRLGRVHYQVGTSSGNAAHIAGWLDEWLQCEFVDLKVFIEPVTTQWATITVTGPRARALLQRLDGEVDFSADGFEHMAVHQGRICGVDTRIMRVSYTGELSFEVNVPASHGEGLWGEIMAAGADFGVTSYGIEALMVLRTEKGFLHVGVDTDGTTMPQDVGFGPIMAKKKDDFIGRRSTMQPKGRRPGRLQFVGFEALEPGTPLPVGGHIVGRDHATPAKSQGYVTSSCMSPNLHRPVALGLLADGFRRQGEVVSVFDDGRRIPARVVSPVSYDPEGHQLNG
ncbi:MAG: sarcosine oxidase subunit alpha family protein [Sphingomonadales bacterium]